MSQPKEPGVHVVRKRLADGSIKEYRYERKPKAEAPKPVIRPRTIGALIDEFERSAKWRSYRLNTKRNLIYAFKWIRPAYERVPIKDFRRRNIKAIQDILADRPGSAFVIVKAIAVLMKFAVDREYRDDNPAWRVEHLPLGEHTPWGDAAILYGQRNLPEHHRRAMVLALYTGQRGGDLSRMQWSDYDGQGIRVKQEKTGADLWVPCHRLLRAELSRWKAERDVGTILTGPKGNPWPPRQLSTSFGKEAGKHAALAGLTLHGLRKTAAEKLAESGCSEHEIGSITGHTSPGEISRYTRRANQRVRAEAAIIKLETARQKPGGNRK